MPANSPVLRLMAPDPEATEAIGAALAGLLQPGEVVTLEGGLGAGKTALARAIIRARAGDPALEVPSPTFALVQPYDGLIHADLYRLADESEIFELGLLDDDSAILLIEWPERAPLLAERAGLHIALTMAGQGRRIDIAARGGRALTGFAQALAAWRSAEEG